MAAQGWDAERAERVREHLEHRSEEQYGVGADELAAHGLDDDTIEGDEVVFPHGYDELPAHLAEGLDVRLGHTVTAVSRGLGGVVVTVDDGARSTPFAAGSAVVTVPVSVLQAGTITFDPPLPDRHREALGHLRMNAFEKVVLRFPSGSGRGRVRGPPARSRGIVVALLVRPHPDRRRADAADVRGGPAGRAIRGWSAERVAASVLDQLRRLYGDRVAAPTSCS